MLASFLVATVNRRLIIIGSVVIAISANALCMVMTSYEWTLWLRVIAGVGSGKGVADGLAEGLTEVFGAMLIGLAVGIPAVFATGRIAPGEPTLVEALGVVLLCAGLSLHFEVSFLLAGMTAGVVVVNFARHHDYPFHEIENVEWPFLVVFFILAGASLELGTLAELGLIGVVYLVARTAGKRGRSWLTARSMTPTRL